MCSDQAVTCCSLWSLLSPRKKFVTAFSGEVSSDQKKVGFITRCSYIRQFQLFCLDLITGIQYGIKDLRYKACLRSIYILLS